MKIDAADVMLERALIMIENTPFEELGELTIDRLSQRLGISVSYLYRVFRDTVKMTPNVFILYEKMVRAATFLRLNPKATVKGIAQNLDFCHAQYFIDCFKSHYGVTPGVYRRSGSNIGQNSVLLSTCESAC